MNNIFLISEKTIKENSLISDNLDGKYIQNAIRTAQDLSLQPIIGQKLFEHLCDGVAKNSLSDLERELLTKYILPVLLNVVISDLVLLISYKFRNIGTVLTTDTNVVLPSLKDLQYVRNDYMLKAEFYMGRLSDFLEKNCAKFKEFPGCECDKFKAKRTAYKNPFVL